MPDDLLRFVSGPTPYSGWWLWLGLALVAVVFTWYVGVFVSTLPSGRLRRTPVLRDLHARLLRHRFARTIREIADRHRSGDLSTTEAGSRLSATLRSFLHQATGARAQYMHIDDIAASDLAPAAPLFAAIIDAQFNTDSTVDLDRLSTSAEELVRTWS